jgi:hypothetical protein
MSEETSGGGRRWGQMIGQAMSLLLEKHLWQRATAVMSRAHLRALARL